MHRFVLHFANTFFPVLRHGTLLVLIITIYAYQIQFPQDNNVLHKAHQIGQRRQGKEASSLAVNMFMAYCSERKCLFQFQFNIAMIIFQSMDSGDSIFFPHTLKNEN